MCRIAGIVGKLSQQQNCSELLDKMLQVMRRGGPDDQGVFSESNVFLGHRRLSIIDLSPLGHQPMSSVDGSLVVVFNGEIYNYQVLKDQLVVKGYHFLSDSDTEVILYAFQEWGEAAFNKFNGMFAFTLFDKRSKQLYLVRDPSGIKPLYYSWYSDTLIFASEVRAFYEVQKNWPQETNWPIYFLAFGSIPYPFTTLKDVYQLEKGAFLKFDITSKSFQTEKYHQFDTSGTITTPRQAEELIRDKLVNALERHLISDAPIGVFLSGGIDSSLLTLLADQIGTKELNTLSVTFKEASFDESKYQAMVLDKVHSNHTAYCVEQFQFMNCLEDIFEAMDQPSIDGVNSYFVAKCAHERGLKAVLSGIGADEYFGGYGSFQRIKFMEWLRFAPNSLLAQLFGRFKDGYKRLAYLDLVNPYGDYLFLRGLYAPGEIAEILGVSVTDVFSALSKLELSKVPSEKDQNYASFLEANIYMENQLLKDTDYMSMWHSLEVRVPFLDKELIEAALQIGKNCKYRKERPKYLLSHTFRHLLPDEVVFREKYGFTFPFSVWLRQHQGKLAEVFPTTPLIEEKKQGFISGELHWSKYWSLVVKQKFSN